MAGRRTTNQWHSRGRNSAPLPVSTCHCALADKMGDRRTTSCSESVSRSLTPPWRHTLSFFSALPCLA